ncbi:MAG: hypothetical protein Q8L48_13975 [Archangium sp.]|nr:hypothetical protein [Archangium sp.]
MGRLIMGIITIAIVGYLGYRAMYGRMPGAEGAGTPKQRLENVQNAANRIEELQQKAADDALKKSAE